MKIIIPVICGIIVAMATRTTCEEPMSWENFVGHLNRSAELIKKHEVYEIVQEYTFKYVRHLLEDDYITMQTKSGKVTVPLTTKIMENINEMVYNSIDLEYASHALKDDKYNFTNLLDAFRFVRSNVIVLDKAMDRLNKSYTRHKDIQIPPRLDFYLKMKADANMVTKGDLKHIIKIIAKIFDDSNVTLVDIKNGTMKFEKGTRLTPKDFIDIGQIMKKQNISYSALFHQAAKIGIDRHLQLNATPPDDRVIKAVVDFYKDIGCKCQNQYNEAVEAVKAVRKAIEDDDEKEAETSNKEEQENEEVSDKQQQEEVKMEADKADNQQPDTEKDGKSSTQKSTKKKSANKKSEQSDKKDDKSTIRKAEQPNTNTEDKKENETANKKADNSAKPNGKKPENDKDNKKADSLASKNTKKEKAEKSDGDKATEKTGKSDKTNSEKTEKSKNKELAKTQTAKPESQKNTKSDKTSKKSSKKKASKPGTENAERVDNEVEEFTAMKDCEIEVVDMCFQHILDLSKAQKDMNNKMEEIQHDEL